MRSDSSARYTIPCSSPFSWRFLALTPARLTATANAILEAQGYKTTTTPNPDQPFKPDSTAIAKPDVDTPSSPPVTVKILASAYDPDRDVYVYCITPVTAKNPTYTVLTDSDLLKPTVVVGQRIKHQIAARTVLEYEITKIGVKGGEFKYGFEVKKRSDYVFDEDELRGLLEGHERASEVDREVNGGKGEGGE